MRPFRLLGSVAVFAAIVAAACAEPAAPDRSAPRLSTSVTQSLVACANGEARTTRRVLTPEGGQVSLPGVLVSVPAGALLTSTELTVHVPASPHLRVDITATGYEHFVFEQPISVALDYSHCPSEQIEKGPISVWYVNDSNGLLEKMRTVDDRSSRTATFVTGHLSGYAIAN